MFDVCIVVALLKVSVSAVQFSSVEFTLNSHCIVCVSKSMELLM